MDKTEADVLKTQELQPFVWLRHIDNIFFIWMHGGAELKIFIKELNKFFQNLNLHTIHRKKEFHF